MQTLSHQKTLPLVNEVLGVFAASECAHDAALAQALVSDPKSALKQAAGIDVPADMHVQPVHNSADEVHVAIPAYAVLERGDAKAALHEADLKDVSGGEIFITLGVVGGVAAGVAVGGAVAGGVGAKIAKDKKKGKTKK